jgi:hypothetical protein
VRAREEGISALYPSPVSGPWFLRLVGRRGLRFGVVDCITPILKAQFVWKEREDRERF